MLDTHRSGTAVVMCADSDEPVLWNGKLYLSSKYPEASEFLILKDVEGKTFLVLESEVKYALEAVVDWIHREANSKPTP